MLRDTHDFEVALEKEVQQREQMLDHWKNEAFKRRHSSLRSHLVDSSWTSNQIKSIRRVNVVPKGL